jgi:hypothetical protein
MKLNDLFEIKKEIKDRNPVAKELRSNPLYKAKTEIDRKKEVKKGYQKHKGKVEEANPTDLGSMNDKMKDVLSKVHSNDEADAKSNAERIEQQRIAKAKELGDAGMQNYIQRLKSHDWTYEYSDDHSVWQRGSSERSEIRRLSAILDPKREIWNKYDPFAKKVETSGYEGQVEPHKHVFKTIDYETIKQIIDDKKLKAFPEKLPNGHVAVHTMNPSRKELVKVMGVAETLEEGIFGENLASVKQSDPLKVISNLAMRKDNNPFPVKTRDGSIEVTPSQAQKFINKFYRASEFTRDQYLDRLKTMQTAKKVFEDEATSQRHAAAWRKEHPIGSNWLNPDDYDADAEGIHYITNTRTEMDIFKVPAKNYDEAFDKWLDGGSTSNPKDNMYYDSTKDYASDHSYWGRKEPEQDDELEDSVQHDVTTGKPVPKTVMGFNVRSKEDKIKDKKDQIALAKRNAPKSGLTTKDVPQLEKELAGLMKEDNNELRTMANSMDTVERTYGAIMQGVRGRGPADESEVGDYIPKGMTKDQILKLIDMLEPQGYNKDFLLTDLADLMKEGVLDNLWGASKQAIRDPNVDYDKVKRDSDFVYDLRDAGYSDKQIRMAYGVLNDPRYHQGNYSGAVATIEKIAKGLSKHPSVANALKRANESKMENKMNEQFNTEKDQVQAILDKHNVKSIDDIEYGSDVYEELFGYYMDSGEMPYGVMKARDGMPDEWIADRLYDLGLLEDTHDNLLNRSNRNKDNEILRLSQLAGIVPRDLTMEDYSKMTHNLIIKLINDDMSDEEIQARTGETGKRIKIIRKHVEDNAMDRAQQAYKLARDEQPAEATQDLARSLNPFKSAVDTNVSPQLTAKGLDAITKGDRPTPNQIKAVEPYVSKLAKAISNPQTSAQMRNVFKKVQ